MYCDLFRDHSSYQVFAIFTKSRIADEICSKIDEFFGRHPQWKNAGSTTRRFIRTDPEPSYMSRTFLECMAAMRWNGLHHVTSMKTVLQSARLA
jgi:hypothetical protein